MKENSVYNGDSLKILSNRNEFLDNSINLIYADPPFFTNRNFGEYDDRWESIEKYISWITSILKELHRILKETGSIYLHCDWHASHYIKVEMDKIFGYNNFRNEIIWQYQAGSNSNRDFGRKHDTILRYSKSNNYVFYSDSIREQYAHATLERLNFNGAREKNIDKVISRGGKVPTDVWYYPTIQGNSKEKINYPTQKPEQLLERIIKASSNINEIVLDPFCGSGTTLAVAKKLERKWIGIDKSKKACEISEKRTALGVAEWEMTEE